MKRIALLIIFGLIAASNVWAIESITQATSGGEFNKSGAGGAQFLKIGVGARANGLAGAYGSLANDLTAIHWNPAGLADVKKISADFSYTSWISDFNHSFAAAALPISDNFTAAAHLLSFNSSDIPVTTIEFPDGTGNHYKYSDVGVGLTIAGYLTDQFSFGFTFKYISSAFASLSSSGIAFDVGTMYETGIQGIKLGFSIHNLGTSQEYRGVDLNNPIKPIYAEYSALVPAQYLANAFSIPLVFRASASADIIQTDEHKLIGITDFITTSDNPEQFVFAAEYTWNDLLMIRGGYRIGSSQFGLGAGAGIKYDGGGFKGQFDYAVNPTSDLGLVHRLSIGVILGE